MKMILTSYRKLHKQFCSIKGHANYSCTHCVHRFFMEEDLESHLTLEHGIGKSNFSSKPYH